MPRFSLERFRDPARRPRTIIWSLAGLLVMVLVVVAALGVTSTYWFCANGCHKVQDDTIAAYNASSHANISCMACHMPVNADPVTFLLHKAEALGELYLTVTNQYHLPLNGESHLALEMEARQCTQCHSPNRKFTPRAGILIDHEVHAESDVTCTTCHNRVAHSEEATPTLTDPKTGALNKRHDDFMLMEACFRCHSLEDDARAPGECAACHPKDFELKPVSHAAAGFYAKGGDSRGHARAALEALGRDEGSSAAEATVSAAATASVDGTGAASEAASIEAREKAEAEEAAHFEEEFGLPPMTSVFYCGTCHAKKFCEDCHGLPMPHPADFAKGHGDDGKARSAVCSNCHAKGKLTGTSGTEFCNNCHHKGSDPSKSWISQHWDVVRRNGTQGCLGGCHAPTFCAYCHVRGNSP